MASAPLIAVLSPHRHPRLRYVLKELSNDLGWRFQLFTDQERWEKTPAQARAKYGWEKTKLPATTWHSHPFLAGGTPTPSLWENVEPQDATDYLSRIFYALSRYEEYEAFTPDAHGRFPASQSKAFEYGYLDRPVVREWALKIAESLRQDFPALPPPKQQDFHFQPSYDIDLLWAWQHRGLRGIAAGGKDLLFGHPKRAWQRFTNKAEQDPYATLPNILALHPRARPYFFWLLADNADSRDPNPYPIPLAQRQIIAALSDQVTHGIHPSYRSSQQPELFRQEKNRLQQILGRAPLHSRQHFLRFRLPDTYRQLQLSGISHDHSMGYAAAIGWRAGTNLPFNWYDLEKEKATGLRIHPFAAMDVTLKNYLKLGPEAAKKAILSLAEGTRPYGGAFCLLWHNSSFAEAYGWGGWWKMYEGLVRELER
ncbi:MAG: polysaccharide deacetylase family protein [Bacteroidota bacterium]